MIDGPYFVLTLLAALGSGLIAGVFFGYSTSVMRALGALPAPQGIAAMQKINVVILNPVFLGVLMGTAALCAVVAVITFVVWPDRGAIELLLGSALYVFGSLGVTIAANIPRNDAMAKLDPEAPESAEPWQRFVSEWTAWNHVRGGAALAACAAFVLALAA
ncbi:anthrone oxygenase family protein [Streptomyces sp. E11-3]|uniref:anthrone oxygenase family protein n=1 Tax=Streptomyces sp. E11-3 TaxID=3110112 RepID=UPI0039813041